MAVKVRGKAVKTYTPDEVSRLRYLRYKARTDLLWFANKILGYDLVIPRVHNPIISKLQHFEMPPEAELARFDRFTNGTWQYEPYVPLRVFESRVGPSRVLILDPRGWYKSTINVISHAIQWIINYPEVRLAIVQATGDKSESVLWEMKQHFMFNEKFKELFPEHCPHTSDWGNRKEFTTLARPSYIIKKEPTVTALSIDKGVAGYHYDVIKFTDIVELNNIVGKGLEDVKQNFHMMWNLLETASGYWIDVEGTRYHYDDVYGDIIEKELEKKRREGDAYKPLWKIHVRGAFKKVVPHDCGYTEQQFTPDELRWSRLTEDGHFVSHFPEKINHDGLEMLRITDEKTFASQQLNDPSDMSDTGMIPFPMKYFRTISREDFKANVKIMMYTAAVDTAETQSERSDYSAVTVVGWSAGGVGYVVDIRHGRWLPDTLVDQVFDVQRVWRPLSFKIEDVSYNRGLMPTFNRRMQTPQGGRSDPDPFINFELIKRETTVTKIERIQNTLQPFYKAGQIVFLEDLDKIEEVKKEFLQFKSTVHEDIIDTLSDHFQNREWFGRLAPREIQERDIQQAFTEALEITSPFSPQFHRGVPEPFPSHYNVTGGL